MYCRMRKRYDVREVAKALEVRKESAKEQAKSVAAEMAAKVLDPKADDFHQGSGPDPRSAHPFVPLLMSG